MRSHSSVDRSNGTGTSALNQKAEQQFLQVVHMEFFIDVGDMPVGGRLADMEHFPDLCGCGAFTEAGNHLFFSFCQGAHLHQCVFSAVNFEIAPGDQKKFAVHIVQMRGQQIDDSHVPL